MPIDNYELGGTVGVGYNKDKKTAYIIQIDG